MTTLTEQRIYFINKELHFNNFKKEYTSEEVDMMDDDEIDDFDKITKSEYDFMIEVSNLSIENLIYIFLHEDNFKGINRILVWELLCDYQRYFKRVKAYPSSYEGRGSTNSEEMILLRRNFFIGGVLSHWRKSIKRVNTSVKYNFDCLEKVFQKLDELLRVYEPIRDKKVEEPKPLFDKKAYYNQKVKCSNCNKSVSRANLAKHQLSKKCQNKAGSSSSSSSENEGSDIENIIVS